MNDRLRVLKVVLSWTAMLAGLGTSVFGVAVLGNWEIRQNLVAWQWYEMAMVSLIAVIPLAASLSAFRKRKVSYLLYLSTAPILALVAWLFLREGPGHLVTAIALISSPFVVLGFFWFLAQKHKWPHIAVWPGLSAGRRTAVFATTGFLFCVAVFLTSIHLAVSSETPGDCGEGPPFADASHSHGAVFTARVIHVDATIGAVAVVQRRFWGLPWWAKVVLLKGGRVGDEFFVDGRPSDGLLTRSIVPVVEMKCTGSSYLKDAAVELRLLAGPSWQGVRIIGQAVTREQSPLPGAKVVITGPTGTLAVTTDQDGIYDISGLQPGEYSVRADVFDKVFQEYPYCRRVDLNLGDVWGCKLHIR
jgi:hypothetical protein